MKIRYETGLATLIQFIATVILTFVSSLASIISGCVHGATADCVTNAFVSLILIILAIIALGVLVGVGYAAQARRSGRLAQMLILGEALAVLIFLFDAKQSPSFIERSTNFVSFLFAVWVIFVAIQLIRAKGGRMVKAHARVRQ